MNGDLELMLAGKANGSNAQGRIFAWHHNGELLQGFPTQVPNDSTGPVMVSDIDGNGAPDIVSSLWLGTTNNYLNRIYVWDNQGNMLPYSPIELIRQNLVSFVSLPSFSQTTLADLDGNGTLDLIAPIGSLEAHAIDLLVSIDPGTMYWPMYRQNSGRTGCYYPEAPQVPPLLDPIGNQSVSEGSSLSFSVNATDPNGDILTLSATGLPNGATFSDNESGIGLFSWTPNYTQSGSYFVQFAVSDGELEDTELVTITVTDVPLKFLSLSDRPDPFSPNRDGVDDTTKITASANHEAKWTLTIRNSAGRLVRTFNGEGSTVSQVWDGTDNLGVVVPDGTYTYTLSGTDAGGSMVSGSGTVTVALPSVLPTK